MRWPKIAQFSRSYKFIFRSKESFLVKKNSTRIKYIMEVYFFNLGG